VEACAAPPVRVLLKSLSELHDRKDAVATAYPPHFPSVLRLRGTEMII
jgi:hypothetical protein